MREGATLAQGNFDADIDGNVDWDDLQILIANFGTRIIGGAPPAPEPATLGLLAIGALAVIRRRRRQTRGLPIRLLRKTPRKLCQR